MGFREKTNGTKYKGCSVTEDGGDRHWCPMPGAVDIDSVVKEGKKRICNGSTEGVRRKRSADQCGTNTCQEGQAFCGALEKMEEEAKKISVREDMDFVYRAEKAAGWSPLTHDDANYRNPLIKYRFYQDVLENIDKFSHGCEQTVEKWNYPSCK